MLYQPFLAIMLYDKEVSFFFYISIFSDNSPYYYFKEK